MDQLNLFVFSEDTKEKIKTFSDIHLKFEDLSSRLIDLWKKSLSYDMENLQKVYYDIAESDIIKELASLPQQDKEIFSLLFKKSLKLEFAKHGLFLDNERFNVYNVKNPRDIEYLNLLILIYCYLCGVKNFPWTFQEKETAKLISFVFHHNVRPEPPTNHFASVLFVINIFQDYKLEIDHRLSPEKIVEHIDQRVFAYCARGVYKDLGLLRVYFFFLKDNNNLKERFFFRVKTELVSKLTKDLNTKERIDIVQQFPFIVDSILSLFDKNKTIEFRISEILKQLGRKITEESITLLKDKFPNFEMIADDLIGSINFVERCSKEFVYLSSFKLSYTVFLGDLVVKTIEDIKHLGSKLAKQKHVSYDLLSKIVRFFCFLTFHKKFSTERSVKDLHDLISFVNNPFDEISGYRCSYLARNIYEYSSYVFEKVAKIYDEFIQAKSEVLEEMENIDLDDKPRILEKYRSVMKNLVLGSLDYDKVISAWKSSKYEFVKMIIEKAEKGRCDELYYLLIWYWQELNTLIYKVSDDTSRLACLYFLLRYIEECQNKEVCKKVKDLLYKKLPPLQYTFLFDDYASDLDFLKRLRWISFVLEFLLNAIGPKFALKETEHSLKIELSPDFEYPENILMLLLFPEAEYTIDRYRIRYSVELKNIDLSSLSRK